MLINRTRTLTSCIIDRTTGLEAAAMPFKRAETGLESVLVCMGGQIPIEGQKLLKKANNEIAKMGYRSTEKRTLRSMKTRKTIVITMIEIGEKI